MTCRLRSCRWWADRRRWRSLHTSLSVNLIHTIVNISIQINTITIYLLIAVPFTKLKTCHCRHIFDLILFLLPSQSSASGGCWRPGCPATRSPRSPPHEEERQRRKALCFGASWQALWPAQPAPALTIRPAYICWPPCRWPCCRPCHIRAGKPSCSGAKRILTPLTTMLILTCMKDS